MTPDILFLINCCKTDPTASDIEQMRTHASQLDKLQLSRIVSLAQVHSVLPLVYNAIEAHAADFIAPDYLAELRQSYLRIVAQNMQMAGELIRILELLKENAIQALAFKGPALAQLAYEDITLRQYCDLDILIKKQDISRCIALLEEDRYIPEIALAEDTRETFFGCVNVIGLGKNIRIEIHWELVSKNYAIDWQEKILWAKNDTTTISGSAVPVLASNTHLLYLCAHGAKHLFERLEWICDIDRFIRSKPDLAWSDLFEDARSLGIERIVLLGLYLSHTLLDLPLPENIKSGVSNNRVVKKLGQHIIDLHFSTPDRQGRSYGSFSLLWRMRENPTDRLRFAYRALFAPKIDDFKYIALPRHLVFLYPLIRPFRLGSKYFRK
jgi:hypothetical protein